MTTTPNPSLPDSSSDQVTTIRCLPRGICSWNFSLSGGGEKGSLVLGWGGEQGAISVNGVDFEVRKHGMFSGHWTLQHEGNETISAKKCSAFTRTFEIDAPGGPLLLRSESAITRCFRLERDDEVIATIRPDHPLTRRASIQILTPHWDSPEIFFSFWLVVLMWRRAAQSNSGG